MSNLIRVDLPDRTSIRRVLAHIPEMDEDGQTAIAQGVLGTWGAFLNSLTDGPRADISLRARELASFFGRDASHIPESAHFTSTSGSHADFQAKTALVRIGHAHPGGGRPGPTFFVSVTLPDDYPRPERLFGLILSTVVYQSDLPRALTTFRGTENVSATGALMNCLLWGSSVEPKA